MKWKSASAVILCSWRDVCVIANQQIGAKNRPCRCFYLKTEGAWMEISWPMTLSSEIGVMVILQWSSTSWTFYLPPITFPLCSRTLVAGCGNRPGNFLICDQVCVLWTGQVLVRARGLIVLVLLLGPRSYVRAVCWDVGSRWIWHVRLGAWSFDFGFRIALGIQSTMRLRRFVRPARC